MIDDRSEYRKQVVKEIDGILDEIVRISEENGLYTDVSYREYNKLHREISKPPNPTPKLRKAFELHRKLVKYRE